jgi:chromosome segregation ATPase
MPRDEEPVAFVEPKTLEEAEKRRSELGDAVNSIQSQLGSLNHTIDGRRMNVYEWEQWRKKAKAAHGFKCAELRKVKEWIRQYHRTYKVTVSALGKGISAVDVAAIARRGMNNLCEYAQAMEAEIKSIQLENAALRERLRVYEPEPEPVAPGEGRDEWRDYPVLPKALPDGQPPRR